MNNNSVIKLNVGGHHFTTSRSTLCSQDSNGINYFDSMLNGKFKVNIDNEENGQVRYFIDRDPEYFKVVLQYLRSGKVYVPKHLNFEMIMDEFEFYNVGPNRTIFENQWTKNKEEMVTEMKYFTVSIDEKNNNVVYDFGLDDSKNVIKSLPLPLAMSKGFTHFINKISLMTGYTLLQINHVNKKTKECIFQKK